jgi:DNA invertase Pin-like site-specific DNA recombinase
LVVTKLDRLGRSLERTAQRWLARYQDRGLAGLVVARI